MAEKARRREVVASVEEAARLIQSGMTIMLGGFGTVNHSMAIVRQMIKNKVTELTVIGAATAGLEVDMLIGAGCVRKVIAPYVGAEIFCPIGHCFRKAAEDQAIEIWECSEWFYVGGIQADKHGNVNLIGLGTPGKFTLRGPGTIGICDTVVTVRDVYIFLTQHDPRRLVERVDFISMPGRAACRELGFWGNGPKWIVTPTAIFDFGEDDLARLYRLFPGVSLEEVRQTTGFAVTLAPDVKTVDAPTADELAILRTHVDRTGVLRG